MINTGNLEERISGSLEDLSPMHKRMARFILDNRYFASFASASQMGEKTGTSAATVVRFAQAIGYEGFTNLQEALRTELPSYLTAAMKMQARLSTDPAQPSTPQEVFDNDIQNIERTAAGISAESLNAVLDAILNARTILVIGNGLSSAAALFLAHSLKVMGFSAVHVQGEGLQASVELAQMQPDDLLIAIDLWRYVRLTVNAAAMAKQSGTHTIAITDSIVSPLAQMADQAFEVAAAGVAHSLSLTALMALLNVLVAMLADRIPQQVVETLQRVDAAYRENDLLIMK